jgi:S-(hydroxymethyl)glutathione dehydrogenase/alcohol dehydrogenase
MPVGPRQVKVAMRATSLCHSDLSAMTGLIPQRLPFVPGHEGAGVVVEVGNEVRHLKIGDRVMICWMPACGRCAACRRGESNMCRAARGIYTRPDFARGDQPVYGFGGFGTFAEELVVDENGAIPIPADVPFAVAALIGCGATTGIGAAINTAQVRPGQSVAVFGLGAVGLSAIQGAVVCGAAEIIAIDPVFDRRQWARGFGATHTVDPENAQSLIDELTGGAGVDVSFEAVGNARTLRAAYEAARSQGTVCLVGVGGYDEAPKLTMAELVMRAKQIRPSFYGGADTGETFRAIMNLYRTGRVDIEAMITHRTTLDGVQEAVTQMRSGEAIRTLIEVE